MTAPWEIYPEIWKTQAAFMSWVRGGIRGGLWKKHPVKLEFLKENMELVPNTNPRSMKRFPKVKAARCALCQQITPQKDIEVDHLTGNHALRSMDDLRAFIEAMIMVTKEDLQLVCKPCHKVKSYAEKQSISFEHAQAEKLAISLIKEKKDVQWLKDRGIVPESSAPKRRTQIVNQAKEELCRL